MADIRQNPTFLDDFNRANESPLSGGGNWARLDSVWSDDMDLVSNQATHGAGKTFSFSYWTPESWNGSEAEAWGYATGGGANGMAWDIGIHSNVGGSNAVDGYMLTLAISAGNDTDLVLYEAANGVYTELTRDTTPTYLPNGDGANGDYYLLIRRNGNDVEGWGSADGVTWTLGVSATDTTYTTGLFAGIGCADNGGFQTVKWRDFGGGPAEEFIPQIYRRPFG